MNIYEPIASYRSISSIHGLDVARTEIGWIDRDCEKNSPKRAAQLFQSPLCWIIIIDLFFVGESKTELNRSESQPQTFHPPLSIGIM